MKEYPVWKTMAWRYARVFLAVFLMELSVNIQKIEKIEDLVPLLIAPAGAAAIAAVARGLRGQFGDSTVLKSLPL